MDLLFSLKSQFLGNFVPVRGGEVRRPHPAVDLVNSSVESLATARNNKQPEPITGIRSPCRPPEIGERRPLFPRGGDERHAAVHIAVDGRGSDAEALVPYLGRRRRGQR